MERFRSLGLNASALFVFGFTWLVLSIFSFDFILRCLRSLGAADGTGESSGRVQSTYGAILWAARYYYRPRRDCLTRATATFILLRLRGIPSALLIGAKKFPFESHAWVECQGQILDEWPSRIASYIPLVRFP